VGYASAETGGVLIVNEQTLIQPSYRIYLLLNTKNELHYLLFKRLKNREAEYVPYLGKNDHQLWWENFKAWEVLEKDFKPCQHFKIDSIFIKPSDEKLQKENRRASLGEDDIRFMYFERLPKGWQPHLPHYELDEFLFTNYPLSPEAEIPHLVKIQNSQDEQAIIQLF
jgi:CRISPR-associated protein Cas5h